MILSDLTLEEAGHVGALQGIFAWDERERAAGRRCEVSGQAAKTAVNTIMKFYGPQRGKELLDVVVSRLKEPDTHS